MIIASELTEAQLFPFAKLFGMNPMIVLAIGLAILGILFLLGRMYYLQWEHKHLINESNGKVLCTFLKKDNDSYDVFCEDFEGKVGLPKKHSVLSFGLPDSLKPPPGHTIGKYTVYPDHVWHKWYPDRMTRSRQIKVPWLIYYENVDHPLNPHNPEEWTSAKYLSVSTSLFTQASNEATAEAAMKRMSGYLKIIEDIVNKIGKLGIMFISGIANNFEGIAILIIVYMILNKADEIIALIKLQMGI
jgi:hypothetical protein